MTSLDSILLYPVRDEHARRQFLIAALLMLANGILPLIPVLILMGYTARIMRQIINEGKEPSMVDWQASDWGQLLKEGLRIFGIRLIFGLPSLFFVALGLFIALGLPLLNSASDSNAEALAPFGGVSLLAGICVVILGIVISLPLALMMGAAEAHAVARESFQAGLRVREWWPILRKSPGAFLGAYLFTFVSGLLISIVSQIAAVTLILLCIVPFLMMAYSAYILLIMNALFARAYAAGQKQILTV